jgi:hypothetical protein
MSDNPGGALTSGTVKLPGIGPVKKVYVYVGVGAVGVLAAYIMWRRQQAAADVTPADADLGDGLTTAAGSDVYQGATAGGAATADPDITPMPTTNVEWTQQILDYFNWLEPGFVSSTVGKYLARVPLSADEADFIRQTWAARGKPPEGPANFTLTTDANTPGGTTMPSVPAGLKVTSVTTSSVALDWTDSTDAQSYQVFRGGSQVGSPTSSAYTDSGLATGTSYSYTVRAVNGSNISAPSAAVTGKTGPGQVTTIPVGTPKPAPGPKQAPKPTYITVTVTHFTTHNPPWNSTISGIASHYGYGSNWQAVWNDPKNIGLRSKRKTPEKIQAEDKVYVKKK